MWLTPSSLWSRRCWQRQRGRMGRRRRRMSAATPPATVDPEGQTDFSQTKSIKIAILSDTLTLACTGKRWGGASQRDCISACQSREKYKTSKIYSASSRGKKFQDIKTLACCQSVDRPLYRRLPGTAFGNNPHFVSDSEYICQCFQTQKTLFKSWSLLAECNVITM